MTPPNLKNIFEVFMSKSRAFRGKFFEGDSDYFGVHPGVFVYQATGWRLHLIYNLCCELDIRPSQLMRDAGPGSLWVSEDLAWGIEISRNCPFATPAAG